MFIYIIIVVILIIATLLFVASYSISLGVYVNSLCRVKTANGLLAITFDDGVDETNTPKVLDVLAQHNAKATFFLIGENAKRYPHIVKRIIDEGHEIGNHSMYHSNTFPIQSKKDIYTEIVQCNEVLEKIIGSKIKYFRPPFGVTNPNIAEALKLTGLQSVGWNVRSFDTMGHRAQRVVRRITRNIRQGDIILMHDNRDGANIILESVLNILYELSLTPVTISELQK